MKKIRNNRFLIVTVVVLIGLFIWKSKLLNIVDRVKSPDGNITATVLETKMDDSWTENLEEKIPAVSVTYQWPFSSSWSRYSHTTYDGLYWSPDSTKYILEMTPLNESGIAMELISFQHRSANFIDYSIRGRLAAGALKDYKFHSNHDGIPMIDITFMKWSEDSTKIQFRYEFTDVSGADHGGSFWFCLVWNDGFLDYPEDCIFDLLEEY